MTYSLLFTFLLCVTGKPLASEDSVTVRFEVVIPDETPGDDPVYWAGSLNRWDPGHLGTGFGARDFSQRMERGEGFHFIELSAPKGTEVSWKYTRGSIFRVEEQADFTYREVRNITFEDGKTVRDTVHAWRYLPDPAIEAFWPKVELRKTELNFTNNGRNYNQTGTLIYDFETGSQFYDFSEYSIRTGVRPDYEDWVYYYVPAGRSTETTLLTGAGKDPESGHWHVYADQNGDRSLDENDRIITIEHAEQDATWRGKVYFENRINGKAFTDSTTLFISHAYQAPEQMRTSVNQDAPRLFGALPWDHRVGKIDDDKFYVSASPGRVFSSFHYIGLDRDGDKTIEMGSGSTESYPLDYSAMHRSGIMYSYPEFELGGRGWTIADIDPLGTWVRLRPAPLPEPRESISEGGQAPDWQATTINGRSLSGETYGDSWVLLNFWGSWCGPCIQAIPSLNEMHERFSGNSFEIVNFAYETEASLERALDHYNLPWPQVLDEKGEHGNRFLVRGYPTYVLIDPDGIIQRMGGSLALEEMTKLLDEHLGP